MIKRPLPWALGDLRLGAQSVNKPSKPAPAGVHAPSPDDYSGWVRGVMRAVAAEPDAAVLFDSTIREPTELLAGVVRKAFGETVTARYESVFANGNRFVAQAVDEEAVALPPPVLLLLLLLLPHPLTKASTTSAKPRGNTTLIFIIQLLLQVAETVIQWGRAGRYQIFV